VAAGTETPAMPVHLLYGCCAVDDCLASKYLKDLGVTLETIGTIKMVHKPDMSIPAVIMEADKVSSEFGQSAVVSEAMLFILCTECIQTVEVLERLRSGLCKELAKKILIGAGINPANLAEPAKPNTNDMGMFTPFGFTQSVPAGGQGTQHSVVDGIVGEGSCGQPQSTLPSDILRLGCDLTAKAKSGKIDNIVGRDDETQRVIEILCRKTKNNPVLIGEAGVGKSAIVEGLAMRIVENRVPTALAGKTIFSLDIGSLMAGTKFRGELEARLEKLINLVTERDDLILFIDEIHNITTATGKEGEIGIAEMLKPRLARGEMQTIGATTFDEYRKYIEKDPALERRFGPITVQPPTPAQSIEILQGLREAYQKFHGVDIGQDAIIAAVQLSDRYITDRNLPDKAIDMLDEACSKAKIKVQIEQAELVKNGQTPPEKRASINAESIAEVVSVASGVPVTRLTNDEKSNLVNLDAELKKSIIGQDKAVELIAKAVRRSRAGVGDANRPVGSFLFLGRTGVGKTEVCKVLAKQLFVSDKALIKLDMSEYQEGHSVSKLVGSPPGYVGYEDASMVCERVRRNPYCIVLFDEIEKAHADVYNVLLQILDEGRLTDNKGKTTSFKNAIIIMTSNAGVENLSRTAKVGFGGDEEAASREEELVMQGVRKRFKPEFINRIDNIVIFNSLTKQDVTKIAKIQINKLIEKMSVVGMRLDVSAAGVEWLADKGFSAEYGARPLRRVIQTELEDKIAEEILARDSVKGIMVDSVDGKLSFKFN
jgi:ATP-dependent Clp protease ATP-binding subunit ClpC